MAHLRLVRRADNHADRPAVETAVLDLVCGVRHNLNDERMAQPALLIFDVGEHLSPDDGLEHGKKDEHREVVEMVQAEGRARDDRFGLEALQLIVSCRAAIPGQFIPMFPAESAEQFQLFPGRNIPGPGIIEVDHSSKALKASSNAN